MKKKWLVYTLKVIIFCLFMSATASQTPSLDSDSAASSDGISSIESGLEQELLVADVLVAEEKMAALRGQTLLILEELKNAEALLQIDPSDEAVRDAIGKLVRKFNIIKAEAKKIDFDLGQDAKVITLTLGNLPKKPKNTKMEQPVPVLVESQEVTVTPLPPLALKSNTFGDQAQLSHQGEPLKKHVAGLLTYFPYEVSPARGIIVSSNGSLKKEWDIVGKSGNENHLMKKLFNSLDGQIVKTHLGGNPVMGLSPEIIGQLVRIIRIDPVLLLQLDDTFLKNWHTSYMNTPMPENNRQLKNYKEHFKKEAKSFLKVLAKHTATETGKQESIDLLLCYLVMEVEDIGVVVAEYAKAFGIDFPLIYFTDQDYEEAKNNILNDRLTDQTIKPYLEQLLFFAREQVGLRKYVNASTGYITHNGKTFPICKELVLRKLISVILYNPEIGKLDLHMLPKNVQKGVSEPLKNFVCMYGDRPAGDPEALQAFLDLVQNKVSEGIRYANGTYELTGGIDNAIVVLKMLFGVKGVLTGSDSKQFEQLLHLLFDNGTRTIRLDDGVSDKKENKWNFIIGDAHNNDEDTSIRMGIEWVAGHGSIKIMLSDDIDVPSLVRNLYFTGKILNVFLPGVYPIALPRMLGYLIKESYLKTKDDFLIFFKEYTSQFSKSIPVVFNDDTDDWEDFFDDDSDDALPSEIFMNVVKAAIEMGIDNDLDKEGLLLEAIGYALHVNNVEMARIICAYGVNPPSYLCNYIAHSNFSEDQKNDLVKKLFGNDLLATLPTNWYQGADSKTIDLLIRNGLDINMLNTEGMTPLMSSAFNFNFWNLNPLVNAGARWDVESADGQTVYDILLKNFKDMGDFLAKPIALEQFKTSYIQNNETHQSERSLSGKIEMLLVLEREINSISDDKIDLIEKERLTKACQKFARDYEEFKKKNPALIAGVSDINAAADREGNTALMLAVSFYDRDTFKLLVEAGAQLDVRNNEGQTVYDILLENIKDMEKVFTTSPTKEEFEQWGSFNGREGTLYSHHAEPSLQNKLATLAHFASVMKDKAASDQALSHYRTVMTVSACKTFLLLYEQFKKNHPQLNFYA